MVSGKASYLMAGLFALCLLCSASQALETEAEAPHVDMMMSMVSGWARDEDDSSSSAEAATDFDEDGSSNSMYEFRMRSLSQRTVANALGAGGFLAGLVRRQTSMEG